MPTIRNRPRSCGTLRQARGPRNRSTSATATTQSVSRLDGRRRQSTNFSRSKERRCAPGCENTSKNDLNGEVTRKFKANADVKRQFGHRRISRPQQEGARHRGKVQPADRTGRRQVEKSFSAVLDPPRRKPASDHQLCECELTVDALHSPGMDNRPRSLRAGRETRPTTRPKRESLPFAPSSLDALIDGSYIPRPSASRMDFAGVVLELAPRFTDETRCRAKDAVKKQFALGKFGKSDWAWGSGRRAVWRVHRDPFDSRSRAGMPKTQPAAPPPCSKPAPLRPPRKSRKSSPW